MLISLLDSLVVVVVEQLRAVGCPSVGKQSLGHFRRPYGVRSHQSDSLSPGHSKLLLEEGHRVPAVSHRVGVSLLLGRGVGFVGKYSFLRTISTTRFELRHSISDDLLTRSTNRFCFHQVLVV